MGGCLSCGERRRDAQFREEAAEAARALGFLPNEELADHPLNRVPEDALDPRSLEQRERVSDTINGGVPVMGTWDIRRLPREQWEEEEVYIVSELNGLVIEVDEKSDRVFMQPRDRDRPSQRWRLSRKGTKESEGDLPGKHYFFESKLSVPDKGATLIIGVPASKRDKETIASLRIKRGAATEAWRYDDEGVIAASSSLMALAPENRTVGARATLVPMQQACKWRMVPTEWDVDVLPRALWTTTHGPHMNSVESVALHEEMEMGPETRFGTNPDEVLGDALIAYSPLLPFIMGSAGDWKTERFQALCQLLGAPLMDRTQTLTSPLRIKILHPIPALDPSFGTPLEQLMLERARGILSMTPPGLNLHVLWSGGIDTTAMIVAFLRVTEGSPADRNRLIVRYCERSVNEYPLFFEKYISAMRHDTIAGHVRDAIDGNHLVVTGDPCDMLFGTFVMGDSFKGRSLNGLPNALHHALDAPWELVIPKMLRARGLLEGGPNIRRSVPQEMEWVTWIQPFVNASPIPIVTSFDFLWWITYTCKFQHDLMRVFYNREQVTQRLMDSVINYYLTDEFQQWSFHNHEAKMQDHRVWASYKQPLKAFIRDFTSDQEYYAAKIKIASVRNSWGYQLAIDDRLNTIKWGKYCISLKRMEEKYEDDLERFLTPEGLYARNKQERELKEKRDEARREAHDREESKIREEDAKTKAIEARQARGGSKVAQSKRDKLRARQERLTNAARARKVVSTVAVAGAAVAAGFVAGSVAAAAVDDVDWGGLDINHRSGGGE